MTFIKIKREGNKDSYIALDKIVEITTDSDGSTAIGLMNGRLIYTIDSVDDVLSAVAAAQAEEEDKDKSLLNGAIEYNHNYAK